MFACVQQIDTEKAARLCAEPNQWSLESRVMSFLKPLSQISLTYAGGKTRAQYVVQAGRHMMDEGFRDYLKGQGKRGHVIERLANEVINLPKQA